MSSLETKPVSENCKNTEGNKQGRETYSQINRNTGKEKETDKEAGMERK